MFVRLKVHAPPLASLYAESMLSRPMSLYLKSSGPSPESSKAPAIEKLEKFLMA